MIIDESLLGKDKNITYEDVSKIYNQLRKNYESPNVLVSMKPLTSL